MEMEMEAKSGIFVLLFSLILFLCIVLLLKLS